MYAQAMDATGLAEQTVTNYKYVSSKVESYRRRENLTWAHHQEVAKLEMSDQQYWLDKASELGWRVKDLRRAIKESKPSEYPLWPPYSGVQPSNPSA